MSKRSVIVLTSLVLFCFAAVAASGGTVSGELKKWHKITIDFTGPETSETATPNPFTDYRLDVTFRNGGKQYVVPGYYAADGNAANTGATVGRVWRVHFEPGKTGRWTYSVIVTLDFLILSVTGSPTSLSFPLIF